MRKKKKFRYTVEEMTLIFKTLNPCLLPTKTAVGRFAKKNGYVRVKQMVKGEIIYAYAREDSL